MTHRISLKQYFPAGGISPHDILIENVALTKHEGVLSATAQLPHMEGIQAILIYQLTLENNQVDWRAVSAKCPHQGADITNDPLKSDGNVYCSLHRRPICIYSEYNQAYAVEKRAEAFFIKATSSVNE